jgi:hypothetical protein
MWVPLLAPDSEWPIVCNGQDESYLRLHLLLDAYRYVDDRSPLRTAVAARARRGSEVIRRLADDGDPMFQERRGQADDLDRAAQHVEDLPDAFGGPQQPTSTSAQSRSRPRDLRRWQSAGVTDDGRLAAGAVHPRAVMASLAQQREGAATDTTARTDLQGRAGWSVMSAPSSRGTGAIMMLGRRPFACDGDSTRGLLGTAARRYEGRAR